MEEKQLDFNAPLLSVRRFSSTGVSSSGGNSNKRTENSLVRKSYVPHYKSELKSGPVRNAGAVPFLWEQIPGRRKDEGNPQLQSLDRPPIAPKLPPGRVLEIKQRPPEKEVEEPPNVIKPQVDNVLSNRHKVSHSDESAIKLESFKDGMKEKRGSDSSSSEGDDAFMDAPDTLSRSESFFFNCSVSGVSGLDGPDATPSGTFSTDPQTRDFMMGRFLPAAKAMASDTPQYAPRRQPQPVVRDREPTPRQVTRVVNADRSHPLSQYRPYVEEYVDVIGEEESEDEDEDDDDYNEAGTLSAKGCGLFPRLCLRSSLCLLNPVPGMKVRSRAPMSSVRKVRTQTRSSHSGALSRSVDEKNAEVAYKNKLISDLQLLDDESKRKSESNELTCWSGSQTPDGSSKNGHSGDGGISPYRNEATQSPFHEGVGFLGIPKQVKNLKAKSSDPYKKGSNNFREVASHQSTKRGSGSLSPMVEKTLYIDSVHVLEAADSNSNSSDVNGDFKDKDSEAVRESQRLEEISLAELFLQDNSHMNVSEESGRLQSKTSDLVGSDLTFSSDRSNHEEHMDSMEGFRKDDNLDQEGGFLVCSKVAINGNLEFDKPQPLNADDQGNLSIIPFEAPLPPPLPKSPSESWLWRTLPSVSSRNGAQFSRKQAAKRSSIDPKWETIVKTSNMNNSHSRFSEVTGAQPSLSFCNQKYPCKLNTVYSLLLYLGLD
ncbi:Protein of unknown function DUF688 [Macleaya cordata]|uniref:Uncharacterized protein n=1 Tax=Macleaya cordata TaxID=56857 RepID=A0A200QT08_MACCD|nr:Protein of unknown function DUF688 [Macleaya cordata]